MQSCCISILNVLEYYYVAEVLLGVCTLLYCCFTAALLLLYLYVGTRVCKGLHKAAQGSMYAALLMLYCCFAGSLLLLYLYVGIYVYVRCCARQKKRSNAATSTLLHCCFTAAFTHMLVYVYGRCCARRKKRSNAATSIRSKSKRPDGTTTRSRCCQASC